MAVLRSVLSVAAMAALATASPLGRRGTVGSDAIVGFSQTVPSGTTGDVYLAYQPYLYVANGCVPFPGVDASGNTKWVSFKFLPQSMRTAMRRRHQADPIPLSAADSRIQVHPTENAALIRGKSMCALPSTMAITR